MSHVLYNITDNSGVNLCKKFEVFWNVHQILSVTELHVFVLVRVTVNAPLI